MDFRENTLYYFETKNNGSAHFECGGVFDIHVIPVLLEMFETHLLSYVVNSQNLGADYSAVSMCAYDEKERLEILLDKIQTTGSADEFDSEKKAISIGDYYKNFSVLKPATPGKVFWAAGLVPQQNGAKLSDKVSGFAKKFVEEIGSLGYNPEKYEKSILQQ